MTHHRCNTNRVEMFGSAAQEEQKRETCRNLICQAELNDIFLVVPVWVVAVGSVCALPVSFLWASSSFSCPKNLRN